MLENYLSTFLVEVATLTHGGGAVDTAKHAT